jgi:hypothetical protein
MSSLLQFRGKVDKKGVHIEVYKTIPGRKEIEWETGTDGGRPTMNWGASWEETFECSKCGKIHPILYTFARKPAGMFGCWVQFKYNGEIHVPDLSCPYGVGKLPKGSKRMTQEESEKAWHQ